MATKKKTRKTSEERWRTRAVETERKILDANTKASCQGDFVMQFAKRYARSKIDKWEREYANTF